jgi:hypothetical protein
VSTEIAASTMVDYEWTAWLWLNARDPDERVQALERACMDIAARRYQEGFVSNARSWS